MTMEFKAGDNVRILGEKSTIDGKTYVEAYDFEGVSDIVCVNPEKVYVVAPTSQRPITRLPGLGFDKFYPIAESKFSHKRKIYLSAENLELVEINPDEEETDGFEAQFTTEELKHNGENSNEEDEDSYELPEDCENCEFKGKCDFYNDNNQDEDEDDEVDIEDDEEDAKEYERVKEHAKIQNSLTLVIKELSKVIESLSKLVDM